MRNPTALGSFNPTQQKIGSRAIEKPCAYWPSKLSMRIQKPFRIISLRKICQQLPWIDILTKNTGGRGTTNMQSVERILYAIFYRLNEQRVRAVLAARAIWVRALLAARAIRVRALLGARAIIVEPHPPPFYTSSLTSLSGVWRRACFRPVW